MKCFVSLSIFLPKFILFFHIGICNEQGVNISSLLQQSFKIFQKLWCVSYPVMCFSSTLIRFIIFHLHIMGVKSYKRTGNYLLPTGSCWCTLVQGVIYYWRLLKFWDFSDPPSVTLNCLFYLGLHTKCHKCANLPSPTGVTSFMNIPNSASYKAWLFLKQSNTC